MKTRLLAVLIFLLLLTPTFVNVPEVSATTTEDLWTTPVLPEDVPRDPMPENFTTEDYLNTTNPYSDLASAQGVLDEVDDPEGDNPLHVLVFVDEEERAITRRFYVWWNWLDWAKLQIERGDESLVSNFGIDIRILDFLEWDSDDSLDTMDDLWYELEADTEQYLGQWYDGEWWSNYVDAIIGITAQTTTDGAAGKAPGDDYLDQGRIFVLLKWQAYWQDDNLVQHEVSHLYYAPDHYATCCVMASHTHFQTWIWEDDLWWVFNDVHCAYTSYSWCTSCSQTIQQNSGRYAGGGGSEPCPILSVYDGTEYVEEGLLDIHNPDCIDEVTSRVLTVTPEAVKHRYLMRLTEHPQTHSHIDQVQLFATIKDGTEIKLPLVSAVHSADGNVLLELLLSDDIRADTLGADHNNGTSEYIDLKFVAPEGLEIEEFTFIIEGYNPEFK